MSIGQNTTTVVVDDNKPCIRPTQERLCVTAMYKDG